MKKQSVIFSIIATLFIGAIIFACEKQEVTEQKGDSVSSGESQIFHYVSPEHYEQASPFQKRFIDQVDAAVNALDVLSKNGKNQNYEAVITVSKDENDKFGNTIMIAQREFISGNGNARMAKPDGKCHVCNAFDGWACVSEVKEYMDLHNDDSISATVTRNGNCVDITYH